MKTTLQKEILQQPDKLDFAKAMDKEVSSLFDKQIWKMVPNQETSRHYDNEMKLGKSIK